MAANDRQVGGGHYADKQKIQHWDYVAANRLDYFQGQITKYVSRWRDKNGLEDLRKALHFLEKYIELVALEEFPTEPPLYKTEVPGDFVDSGEPQAQGYVNQDGGEHEHQR